MKFIRFDPLAVQSTLEYWTDERMANAILDPLLPMEIPEIIQHKDDEFSKAETEMFLCGDQNMRFHELYVAKVDVNIEPYNKAGRLFYTKENGKDYACTAQFVGADNIILTAAHGLKPIGRKWSTNAMFRRAYRTKVADQHLNVVLSAAGINTEWYALRSPNSMRRIRWDYAFAKTTENSNVGHLSLSINLPEKLKSIGYTKNYGIKGKYMCEGRGTRGRLTNGRVKMIGNFMENGSSGGAWFERDGHNVNEVVGVNTGGDYAGNMYGPIFDQKTIDLMNAMIK